MYDSREIIDGDAMKKVIFLIFLMWISCFVWGCSAEKISTEKIRDIPFTVLEEEKIPKELKEAIEEREEQPFKYTYDDQGELFIAVGYGEQPTSGYSIEVKELY